WGVADPTRRRPDAPDRGPGRGSVFSARRFYFRGGLTPPPTALAAKPRRSLFSERIGPASPKERPASLGGSVLDPEDFSLPAADAGCRGPPGSPKTSAAPRRARGGRRGRRRGRPPRSDRAWRPCLRPLPRRRWPPVP